MTNLDTHLSPRLTSIAEFVCKFGNSRQSLVDIGSDHALLAKHLLQRDLIGWVTAIEKHNAPFERTKKALADYDNCNVILADGLNGLSQQTDLLTISGMGALKIVSILNANPSRVPESCILQSNDSPAPIRKWARESGFHLIDERLVQEKWRVAILGIQRRAGEDPAYSRFLSERDLAAADFFGPHLLLSNCQLLPMEIDYQQKIADSLPINSSGRIELTRLIETAASIRALSTKKLPE